MELFVKMGATTSSGEIISDPIQFVAKSEWDAPQVYILSKDEQGIVQIAKLSYNANTEQYELEGEIAITGEMCGLSEAGDLFYMSISGNVTQY